MTTSAQPHPVDLADSAAPHAVREPSNPPSGKPTGSMIYTVQKGANIVPSWRKDADHSHR